MWRSICVLAVLGCHPHASFVPVQPPACTQGGHVIIIGAVARSGTYDCTPAGMTLRSLVAAAGGLEHASEPNGIRITRRGVTFRISYDDTIDATDLPDLGLANGDFVYVDIKSY